MRERGAREIEGRLYRTNAAPNFSLYSASGRTHASTGATAHPQAAEPHHNGLTEGHSIANAPEAAAPESAHHDSTVPVQWSG